MLRSAWLKFKTFIFSLGVEDSNRENIILALSCERYDILKGPLGWQGDLWNFAVTIINLVTSLLLILSVVDLLIKWIWWASFRSIFCFVLTWYSLFNVCSLEKRQRTVRLAVTIGNTEYHTLARLKNPINDAKALKEILVPLGFDVRAGYNLEKMEILELLSSVLEDWQHRASEIVFYYSGRGISIGIWSEAPRGFGSLNVARWYSLTVFYRWESVCFPGRRQSWLTKDSSQAKSLQLGSHPGYSSPLPDRQKSSHRRHSRLPAF